MTEKRKGEGTVIRSQQFSDSSHGIPYTEYCFGVLYFTSYFKNKFCLL